MVNSGFSACLPPTSTALPTTTMNRFSRTLSLTTRAHSTTPSTTSQQPKTHFGYRDVPEQAKQGMVFSSVASSYDIMNDAMSLGIHRLWKDHYVKSLDPHGDIRCLDVAGGTADIGLRILDHARLQHSDRNTKFVLGNAEDLASSSIEITRVLKKGGRFSCLEFGKVNNPLLAGFYELYSFNVIPNLGHILASDRDSYQYLVESIRKFPTQSKFAEMIKHAGFSVPNQHKHLSKELSKGWEDLTFGIASIHNGIKL
ncbi:hypothetical protein PSHT_01334 [Puccinia striiformis]|uniref:Ubiquinone biosynthesis methyltransferase COQ5 n=1 Tax=Puccinia striiformis TaxID=27350 RepID=A0A2S4WL24_9BASI|nr:hypothetical protein PSHT_01334 [Puccinia striiformis]